MSDSGQQTTAESRAALRQRFTPGPVPKCGTCKRRMVQCYDIWNSASDATYIVYRCPLNHSSYDARKGDSEILAAVDDADALAGALAEASRLHEALAWYADPANWRCEWMGSPPLAWQDRGKIARAALAPEGAPS